MRRRKALLGVELRWLLQKEKGLRRQVALAFDLAEEQQLDALVVRADSEEVCQSGEPLDGRVLFGKSVLKSWRSLVHTQIAWMGPSLVL